MQAKHFGCNTHLEGVGVFDHKYADGVLLAGIFRHVAFLPAVDRSGPRLYGGMEKAINLTQALGSFDGEPSKALTS